MIVYLTCSREVFQTEESYFLRWMNVSKDSRSRCYDLQTRGVKHQNMVSSGPAMKTKTFNHVVKKSRFLAHPVVSSGYLKTWSPCSIPPLEGATERQPTEEKVLRHFFIFFTCG